MTQPTDFPGFMGELDAGVFQDKLGFELSQLALAVVEHGKPGKLTMELSLKQVGNHPQVEVTHKLISARPTRRGKKTEEDATQSVMHVNPGGKLTVFPENQMDLLAQREQAHERKTQRQTD